jgi:8-oxo-dGTP pyrophosphatase MutT (NUDIX family)
MRLDLPAGRIVPVASCALLLDPAPHALEAAAGAEIDANWLAERQARPAIHDGRVALFSRLSWDGAALTGTCHIVRYATFLYWRGGGRREMARHLYAHAVLAAADGPLVAVRMGSHTVNAGRIYFAAGSLEPDDFRDGTADLDANMRREVMEETGLDLAGMRADPSLHALALDSGTVVLRRYVSPLPAAEIVERVAAHVAAETEPEITGAVVIDRPRPAIEGLAAQMPAILDWHFSHPPS